MLLPAYFHPEDGTVPLERVLLVGAVVTLGVTLGYAARNAAETPPGAGKTPHSVQDTSAVAVRVMSDFAGALNGWTLSSGEAGSRVELRLEPGPDGVPGFARFVDGRGGAAAHLLMPSAHTGDQSGLGGGTIAFDLRKVSGGRPIGAAMPLLRIAGANGVVMTYSEDVDLAPGEWTRVVIDVVPGAWQIRGRAAGAGEIAAILADVASVELRIEQAHGGDEVIDLDRVVFSGSYDLPALGP